MKPFSKPRETRRDRRPRRHGHDDAIMMTRNAASLKSLARVKHTTQLTRNLPPRPPSEADRSAGRGGGGWPQPAGGSPAQARPSRRGGLLLVLQVACDRDRSQVTTITEGNRPRGRCHGAPPSDRRRWRRARARGPPPARGGAGGGGVSARFGGWSSSLAALTAGH